MLKVEGPIGLGLGASDRVLALLASGCRTWVVKP